MPARKKELIMNKKYLFAVLGFLLVGILSYILYVGLFKQTAPATPAITGNKIQVTTSFYPLYFFASQIAGDKADVKNITPLGAEPHDYEPTPQDIVRIQESSLLIVNGAGFEPWLDKIRSDLREKHTVVEAVSESLFFLNLNKEGKTIVDTHVWLSPNLAITIANNTFKALIKIDPKNESYYNKNYVALSIKLDKLDKEYQKGLASCKSKDIIVSHAAFGYLAETYGLNQVPIAGLSQDEEPSPADMAEVTKFARENNVKYIFFETLVSPKLSETIANEVGAKTLVLDPIEGLSDDDFAQGKNYFTVTESNLKNLQTALQCQ